MQIFYLREYDRGRIVGLRVVDLCFRDIAIKELKYVQHSIVVSEQLCVGYYL